MAIPIPEACEDCWEGKLIEANGADNARLCPLLARAALSSAETPDKIDALVARQAVTCRGIGGATVSQVVSGDRQVYTLLAASENLAA